MVQLKIQDQLGPIEIQDQAGLVQFKAISNNQTGLTISASYLGSFSILIAFSSGG